MLSELRFLYRHSDISYAGRASDRGFVLEFRHRFGARATIEVEGISKSQLDTPGWPQLIWYMLVIGVGVCSFQSDTARIMALGYPLATTASVLFLVLAPEVIVSSFANRAQFQWHSCEHKVFAMVFGGFLPTMQCMRQISPVTVTCVSVRVVLRSVAIGCVLAMLLSATSWPHPELYICISSCVGLLGLEQNAWSGWPRRILLLILPIGIPMIIVAMALQRILFLRTPTEDQLQRSLELLICAYRRHPWLIHPKLLQDPEFDRILARPPRPQI